MKIYSRTCLSFLLGLALLLLFLLSAPATAHMTSFTETKAYSYAQVFSYPASSSSYLRKVSSSSQQISGNERPGNEGNAIGSFTGTEAATVTDSFTKGRATKVRKTTFTAKCLISLFFKWVPLGIPFYLPQPVLSLSLGKHGVFHEPVSSECKSSPPKKLQKQQRSPPQSPSTPSFVSLARAPPVSFFLQKKPFPPC